jgi:hypothetical protein
VRTALFASLTLALSACGDPLFFAEVEAKQMCITLPSQTIPSAPDISEDHTVRYTATLDLGDGIPGLGEKGTTGTIKATSLRLNSTTDMSVITSARVDLGSDENQPTPYMHYEQLPGADPTTLAMIIDQDIDLFARLAESKTIDIVISLTGRPPTESWTADITTCMSAKILMDPLELIKK